MKNFLTLSAALVSAAAFAGPPAVETAQVARVLINNPEIVKELNQNNSAHLTELKVSEVKTGVFQYDLVFARQCHCIPSFAVVSVLEDLTPTYSDGSIKYTSSIKIEDGPQSLRR